MLLKALYWQGYSSQTVYIQKQIQTFASILLLDDVSYERTCEAVDLACGGRENW